MDSSSTKATVRPSIWRRCGFTALARFIAARSSRSLSRPYVSTPDGIARTRAEIGLLGEELAAKWLTRSGRKVLFRNFRAPHGGEVDLVCRHKTALTFVEVKTRTSAAFGRPADAVGPDKQRLIQRGALEWLRLLGRPKLKFRFDIVEVLLIEGEPPKLSVIENAFQMPASSTAGR